jgi:uncharacterized protein (TIGR03437 family)
MATGASASAIQTANIFPGDPDLSSEGHNALMDAAKLAIASQDFEARMLRGEPAKASAAATGQAPSILPGGVVPVYGTASTIQAGEWISIYGSNLAAQTTLWTGNFPQQLGGTSVTINGKPGYLLFVSPGQINLQAPSDSATGTVPVVVTTAAGSAMSTVTLGQFAPSFGLLDSKHVAGIILRTNGRGAYGGGTYDILGPTGKSLGYPTVAAKAGDNVVLFGFGLGPTTPEVAAGQAFAGAAPTNTPLSLYISQVAVNTTFAGMSGAGLYQVNLRIPYGRGTGDVPLRGMVGGVQSQAGVVISLDDPVTASAGGSGTYIPVGTSPPPFLSSYPPGTNGGTFSGGGGGGTSDVRRKRWVPGKLKFPPK